MAGDGAESEPEGPVRKAPRQFAAGRKFGIVTQLLSWPRAQVMPRIGTSQTEKRPAPVVTGAQFAIDSPSRQDSRTRHGAMVCLKLGASNA